MDKLGICQHCGEFDELIRHLNDYICVLCLEELEYDNWNVDEEGKKKIKRGGWNEETIMSNVESER